MSCEMIFKKKKLYKMSSLIITLSDLGSSIPAFLHWGSKNANHNKVNTSIINGYGNCKYFPSVNICSFILLISFGNKSFTKQNLSYFSFIILFLVSCQRTLCHDPGQKYILLYFHVEVEKNL